MSSIVTPTVTKVTVATPSTETSLTLPTGHTFCMLINRGKNAINWSWQSGKSASDKTIPAGQSMVIDVPTNRTGIIYFQSPVVTDTLETQSQMRMRSMMGSTCIITKNAGIDLYTCSKDVCELSFV